MAVARQVAACMAAAWMEAAAWAVQAQQGAELRLVAPLVVARMAVERPVVGRQEAGQVEAALTSSPCSSGSLHIPGCQSRTPQAPHQSETCSTILTLHRSRGTHPPTGHSWPSSRHPRSPHPYRAEAQQAADQQVAATQAEDQQAAATKVADQQAAAWQVAAMQVESTSQYIRRPKKTESESFRQRFW